MEQAVSRQQQAKENLERSQLADAADNQNDAAEHIQQAIDALKDKQDQSQDQQSTGPPGPRDRAAAVPAGPGAAAPGRSIATATECRGPASPGSRSDGG